MIHKDKDSGVDIHRDKFVFNSLKVNMQVQNLVRKANFHIFFNVVRSHFFFLEHIFPTFPSCTGETTPAVLCVDLIPLP